MDIEELKKEFNRKLDEQLKEELKYEKQEGLKQERDRRMKIVKINQLDSSIEDFTVDKLDKKTFDFVLGIFGFEFNKLTGYWHTENEMVGLEDEKMFIIPLPGLVTTDGKQQYLTHRDNTFFACRREKELRQIWKEEHLKFVPEVYRQFAVEFDDAWERKILEDK